MAGWSRSSKTGPVTTPYLGSQRSTLRPSASAACWRKYSCSVSVSKSSKSAMRPQPALDSASVANMPSARARVRFLEPDTKPSAYLARAGRHLDLRAASGRLLVGPDQVEHEPGDRRGARGDRERRRG